LKENAVALLQSETANGTIQQRNDLYRIAFTMSSSSKTNVKLSVDTKLGVVDNLDWQQPSPASPHTSFSSVEDDHAGYETPRNQIIMTVEDRQVQAEQFVTDIGLELDELDDHQRTRAKKIMSRYYTWSPTRGDTPSSRNYVGTTFEAEWKKIAGGLQGGTQKSILE